MEFRGISRKICKCKKVNVKKKRIKMEKWKEDKGETERDGKKRVDHKRNGGEDLWSSKERCRKSGK